MTIWFRKTIFALSLLVVSPVFAQTIATGDARTVTEPVFPATCTVLHSQIPIVAGAPASETSLDTLRILVALTTCPVGQAVELAGSLDGANYAYVSAPLNIPSGVGLIVDGGVTLFASRNPADYQTTSTELCGSYGPNGNGCNNFFSFANNGTNVGSGIYGYGVIDARGGSTLLKNGVDSGISWWANADAGVALGFSQDNPIIMKPARSTNLTLYKITFRNSPVFHIGLSGVSGFTAWGIKIAAPWTARNTDGIDPQGTNITISDSSISDGDDNIAVGAGSFSSNVTIQRVTTYSGHGVSVGSYTSGGLTNMLVTNVNMAGTAADGNATGIRLKSAVDRGGLLKTITYQNMCIRDTRYPLQLNPFYNTNTGTSPPIYSNVVLQNIHFLAPTASTYPYKVQLQGYDVNHPTTVTMNNVVFDQLLAANVTPAPQYLSVTLAGNVYPAFLQSLTGAGVAYSGIATSVATTAFNCPVATVFPYIVGEAYLSSASATNLQTATITAGSPVTLNAMVEPAESPTSYGAYTGAALPTKPVSFYEGTTLVGSASLGANGTLASLTLSSPAVGNHSYSATYPGDTHYGAITFGSLSVTVNPFTSTTTLAAPSTGVFGTLINLMANVSATATGTPTGSVTFRDGTNVVGTVALSGTTAVLPISLAVGSHAVTAQYSGDSTFSISTSNSANVAISAAASTTTVTANPMAIAVNGSVLLTAVVSGVSGAATPTGSVTFYDGPASLGSASINAGVATLAISFASIGSHSIAASYAGDANYALSSGSTSETVTSVATSLVLSASALTVPLGGQSILTVTVSPTGSSGIVTFFSGSTAIGTASLSPTSGVGSYAYSAAQLGSASFSATLAAGGNYAAAASGMLTVNVVNPFSLTASTSAISIAPGSSGSVNVVVTPQANYAGTATISCSSPVTYIQCSVPASVSLTGTAASNAVATISIASTVSAASTNRGSAVWAILMSPLGLLGLVFSRRSRRGIRVICFLGFAVVALNALTGCGSSALSASTRPSGSQVVTISASSSSVTQTIQVTVSVAN